MKKASADVSVATTKANQVKEVALIEVSRKLAVSKLELEAAQNEADALVAKGKAEADVIKFKNFAEAQGLAESVSYPCSTALAGNWFPPQERGRATGIIFAGLGVGAALTSPVVAWLVVSYNWQISFYICSLAGILLALILGFYLTESPGQHPRISESELEYIGQGPSARTPASSAATPARTTSWLKILTNRDVLLLFASYICIGYTVYIYFAWFYRYLTDERGFDALNASYFAIFPFLAMTVTAPLGGWLTDRLLPRVGKKTARRMIVMGGKLPCLPLLFLG